MSKVDKHQISRLIQKASSIRSFSVFAFLVYIFFVFFYMGPIILNCGDVVAGIGDSTGGPIWRASLEPDQSLVGSTENQTNYPFGENLYSPVGYAIIAQTGILRSLDVFFGPVCSYNLFNVIGYLTTALVMFFFIYCLLRSRWIALLGGYAVAFTPYIQSKIGGHPSYGYGSLLIGVLWLSLHIIRKRQYRHGVALSAILALCAYFDPYFILLSLSVLAPVLGVWLIIAGRDYIQSRVINKKSIKTFKVFLLAFILTLLFITPLVYIRISDAAAINASTGPTRSNVVETAKQCSNLPLDYLLPDPYNMHLVGYFGQSYTAGNIDLRNWCGPGESRVSISVTMMAVIVLGSAIYLRNRLKKRSAGSGVSFYTSYSPPLVIGSFVAVLFFAILLGLPPEIKGIITPSGILIKLTETWRIYAREYLVVNIAIVTLFCMAVVYIKKILQVAKVSILLIPTLFILILLAIIAEYQIFSPFDPFNFKYSRDVPQIYQTIKKDNHINAFAEYPIDKMGVESDIIAYYTTMQYVHGKPILNSALVNNPHEKLHLSLKDLSDPQTIPILRKLGIQYITIHGISLASLPDDVTRQITIIKEVYGIQLLKSAPNNTIILAKIKPGPIADYYIAINKGYVVNLKIMKSSTHIEYELLQGAELESAPVLESTDNANQLATIPMCFEIKTVGAPKDQTKLEISTDGRITYRYDIHESQYETIKLYSKIGEIITLSNEGGYNMRINNLGCR
jgi:hypothetical protein